MTISIPEYSLFCIGHPLLDIQVRDGAELLKKYGLKENDGILAQEKHAAIYDELPRDYEVTYVAGGAAQNTARGAAYILPPNSVVYVGCVGDDGLAEQLRAANRREGLLDLYQVKVGEKTGACAVILTGHHRSLVTSLRSARLLDESHFQSPQVTPYLKKAAIYYVEGYVLSHAADLILDLARKASSSEKLFALNFSAPYIAQYFTSDVQRILPFCDVVVANEAEAESWAEATGHSDAKDIASVAKSIAGFPKASAHRSRVVVITHGAKATVWVTSDNPEDVRVHPVHALAADEIVDTNGAGDAFTGGFLGALVAGKSWDECVDVGHKLAAMCIGQVGPQFKWPKVKVL